MRLTELLTLMDREADLLAAENNHSASILMRAGAEKIREMAAFNEKGGTPPLPPPRK